MKRVKLMLSAIAVFAVVGGALAFKAKIPNNKIYTSVGTTCVLLSPASFTTTAVAGQFIPTAATLTIEDIQGVTTTEGNCTYTTLRVKPE